MKTLFEGTSEYYDQYRPKYPPAIFSDVVSKFYLTTDDKILDIGCGPGVLTIPLSKYVKEVVALDIDPGMIKAGQELAEQAKIKNIEWVLKSADDLDENIGTFKLITFGASFHWVNREKFLKLAFNILTDDGGIFITWSGHSIWNKDRTEWEEKTLETIKKYLGNERRAGEGVYQESKERHEDIIKAAGFKKIEVKKYPLEPKLVSVEEIIKGQYTTSYAAKRLFGDKSAEFEKELTAQLLKINPTNQFEQITIAGSIYAWKN